MVIKIIIRVIMPRERERVLRDSGSETGTL